ncbi:MAG TPA: hypothetical protein DDW91_08035, partial [Shewanella frigidimarina]|nr:hypothetical protein [Shewanella frigidimarina]
RKTATTGLNAIIHACDRNDSSAAIIAVQAYFSERLGKLMTLTQISGLIAATCGLSMQLYAIRLK